MSRKTKTVEPPSAKTSIGKYCTAPLWLAQALDIKQAMCLWVVIAAKYADRDTGQCFPYRRTLADDLSTSLSTIDSWLAELIRVGALTIAKKSNGFGRPTSNVYVLNFNKPGGTTETGGARVVGSSTTETDTSVVVVPPSVIGDPSPRPAGDPPPSLIRRSHSKYPESGTQNQENKKETAATSAVLSGHDEIDFSDAVRESVADFIRPFSAEDVLALYNATCADPALADPLPRCTKLTDALRKHAAVRLRQEPTRDYWHRLFTAAATSSLCDGNWSNHFACGFEWFIKNDENPRKVLAGNYAPRKAAPARRAAEQAPAYAPDAAHDARRARHEAAQQATADREQEAADAINQMPPAARDALMVAADADLAGYRDTMATDAYERALHRAMIALIVEGARGRSILDAVAYFTAQHGGTAVA